MEFLVLNLFVKGDDVYFSEVSPRPHDTGMVTMITQSASEFALHVRAVLGLPIDFITYGAGASAAYKASGDSFNPQIDILILHLQKILLLEYLENHKAM